MTAISKAVIAGQQKKLDFGQIWQDVAEKAKGYSRIGDAEAEAIASMLAGPKGQTGGAPGTAGHVFIQGYLAGKFLDAAAIAGVAKILQAYAAFADPRIINVALLGMGIGFVSKKQGGSAQSVSTARASHAAKGMFEMRSTFTASRFPTSCLSCTKCLRRVTDLESASTSPVFRAPKVTT